MKRIGLLAGSVAVLVALIGIVWLVAGWWGTSELDEDREFTVASGSTLTAVADKLAAEGAIDSANGFLLRAKLLGSGDPVQAGEFLLPAGTSPAGMLDTLQHGQPIRRFVTIPEGTPSILVHERLMAEPLLTGEIPVLSLIHI